MSKPFPILERCASQLPPPLLQVIDAWQRGFPLASRPFEVIAAGAGLSEDELLCALHELSQAGVLSRVGATIRPNTVTASMLAAMRVPAERLDEVAAIVNAEPGVNHNYEREHDFNLWFVIAAGNRGSLARSVDRIRALSGLDVMELPLERSYFIDLGFALQDAGRRRVAPASSPDASSAYDSASAALDAIDHRLLALLEHGLALVPRPFDALAQSAGIEEAAVLARIARLVEIGVVTRFGFIVRHRRLGYRANAMCVWDVADGEVDRLGELFARQDFVTLCYRRPRRLPDWPNNLFCMIHGRDRDTVLQQVANLGTLAGESAPQPTVLFSRRCFMQRGPQLTTVTSLPATGEPVTHETCHA